MNDGTWDVAYDTTSNTHINSFEVLNDAAISTNSNEYPLLRNVHLDATTNSYVTVSKLVHGGGVLTDLSAYRSLNLTAMANGTGVLKIVLVKNSITDWNSQYTYSLPISQISKGYVISLSEFKSATIDSAINPNDIVQILFVYEVTGNANITASLNNVKFTKDDPAYQAALLSKAMIVYPNPVVNNSFNCSFNALKAESLMMKIIEVGTGRVIYTQPVISVAGQNTIKVQLNSSLLNTNLYTISLEGDNTKYIPQTIKVVR